MDDDQKNEAERKIVEETFEKTLGETEEWIEGRIVPVTGVHFAIDEGDFD